MPQHDNAPLCQPRQFDFGTACVVKKNDGGKIKLRLLGRGTSCNVRQAPGLGSDTGNTWGA